MCLDRLPEEGGCISHELPGLNDHTKDRAQDLTSADGQPFREETGHVRAERNRIGAKVGRKDAEVERKSSEENACACSRVGVVVKNGLEKIPDVPVRFTPLSLDRSSRRHAEEENDDRGNEDTDTLDWTSVTRLLAVTRKVRLVDQHGRERAENGIDASHDSPSQGCRRKLTC